MTTGDFTEVASNLTDTFYSQSDLTENTTNKFKVRAFNGVGFGELSSELSISTLLGDIGDFYPAKGGYDNYTIQVNDIDIFTGIEAKTFTGTAVSQELWTNIGDK